MAANEASFECTTLLGITLTYSSAGKIKLLPPCAIPNPPSTLLIHVQFHNHWQGSHQKILMLKFDFLNPMLPSILRSNLSHTACCYGNRGYARSLFHKHGRTGASVPYWPLRKRLNAGDISEVEFAISTNMRASSNPAWQHIKSIQITWIPNTLIPVSGGMHYN